VIKQENRKTLHFLKRLWASALTESSPHNFNNVQQTNIIPLDLSNSQFTDDTAVRPCPHCSPFFSPTSGSVCQSSHLQRQQLIVSTDGPRSHSALFSLHAHCTAYQTGLLAIYYSTTLSSTPNHSLTPSLSSTQTALAPPLPSQPQNAKIIKQDAKLKDACKCILFNWIKALPGLSRPTHIILKDNLGDSTVTNITQLLNHDTSQLLIGPGNFDFSPTSCFSFRCQRSQIQAQSPTAVPLVTSRSILSRNCSAFSFTFKLHKTRQIK
jgi:hypothetical protein